MDAAALQSSLLPPSFFWLFLSRHSRPSFVFFEQPRSDDETDGVLE
jgi:hypothetical protein